MSTRSWLIASSLNPKLLAKAHAVAADVALLDLEDSVAAQDKDAAREALAGWLGSQPGLAIAVRINRLRTAEGLRDLLQLVANPVAPQIVILPKVSVPDDLTLAAQVLLERHPAVRLYAIVETAATLCDLRALRAAPRGLSGLHFGAADLAADLGIDPAHADWSHVRYEVGLIARRLGISAIDTPCFQYRDETRLGDELAAARRFGFTGKIAIHPAQVPVINHFFSPSADAVSHARRLVQAHEQGSGEAIFTLNEQMAGPPMLEQACRVIEQAADLDVTSVSGRKHNANG